MEAFARFVKGFGLGWEGNEEAWTRSEQSSTNHSQEAVGSMGQQEGEAPGEGQEGSNKAVFQGHVRKETVEEGYGASESTGPLENLPRQRKSKREDRACGFRYAHLHRLQRSVLSNREVEIDKETQRDKIR